MSAMRTWEVSRACRMAGRGLFCQAIMNQRALGWAASSADWTSWAAGPGRDVAGGAAFLEDLHVVDLGVAEEGMLVAVEAGGEGGEGGVAGIDPAGAGKAVPVALGDDVGSGVEGGEVGGDDAVVAGEDGGDAEGAEARDEALGGGGAAVEEVEGDGFMKQHMLPMSCQFWWAGWVIQRRMARSE